jgi:hypothetical protein
MEEGKEKLKIKAGILCSRFFYLLKYELSKNLGLFKAITIAILKTVRIWPLSLKAKQGEQDFNALLLRQFIKCVMVKELGQNPILNSHYTEFII